MTIFKIKEGGNPVEIEPVIGREKPLEEFLEENPTLIQKDMFIIGRQVTTTDGKYIDLLGIDKSCSVIIIELKKDVDSSIILNKLYKHTLLQSSFNNNILALNKGRPEQLNLKQ